jgi:hypothetical protein
MNEVVGGIEIHTAVRTTRVTLFSNGNCQTHIPKVHVGSRRLVELVLKNIALYLPVYESLKSPRNVDDVARRQQQHQNTFFLSS